jgi:dTDP-glucose 4,6-dehydratase
MKKKLLITGTSGFIFSNFIRRIKDLAKNSYNLVGIDKISNRASLNDRYINKNYNLHIVDITDAHCLDVIFDYEKPDIVIHGAASSHVDISLKDPNRFVMDNVLGTQNIINCCVKYKVEKLVYISTDETTGHLTSEKDPSLTEEASLNPRNPYSASKAAGELLVKAANQSFGLKYNITRSSNNYGHNQTTDKLIPKVIKCILNDEKIPVYGQGLQIRDWLHVNDNCSAILTILEKGKDNEIYNITANQEISNIELVQKICNIIGKGHQLITYVEDRPGHDFRYSIDNSKLKALGWASKYNLKEGLPEVVEWYMINKWARQ